jgi:predicted Zn finger-like uncharacterized protein
MYTQCPDCEIAFKVTAEVLKQAAGKVRCGGCGNAFNALAYLSEQMPKQAVAQVADAAVPELIPEIIETDDGLPQSISAEQSAALLKTLDELAGSDIRIEDTGVEWRVLDEEEAAEPAADDDYSGLNDNTPVTNVDEYLDDTETPIDEFLTATPEVVDAPEIFEEANVEPVRTSIDELRFDDNTPLPEDFGLGEDSSATPPQAVEIEEEVVADVTDNAAPEIALSEPDEWTDILDEFQELVDEVAAPIETTAAATDVNDESDEPLDESIQAESSVDRPLDMNSQFALQAEATGIELSGINDLDAELEDNPEPEDEPEVEDEPEPESEPEQDDAIEQLDLIDDDDKDQELIDEPIVENHVIENELAGTDDDSGEHYVPPMTKEEHTVNMQIDQDLMALAIEDDDGFSSTIIIPEKDTDKKSKKKKASAAEEELDIAADDSLFETIIMEGEDVRFAIDSKKLAVNTAAAAKLAHLARAKEVEEASRLGGNRYGMIAGVLVLLLLLAGQLMHQSREALATIPAFSSSVGQIYRAIGQPVQPAWDITGWRFEVTKGSTDDEDEELTVFSRLGNNSDRPLPYPLIGISLTDRFEETLGSRILDPAEYLPRDLDPRKLVEPGNTFNAVITIKSTSEDATGFKLIVCYRLTDGQLRCAIDDFL